MSAGRSASSPRTAPLAEATAPAERARRLLDGDGSALPATPDPALAWALKDACYAAWSSEPRRAAQAADLLGATVAQWRGAGHAGLDEPLALAAWTRGIALVTRGQMAEAVVAFDEAAQGFEGVGQPSPAAQTQVPKIMALAMLGRHAEASECAERTLAAFAAQGDWHAASKVSLNLGSLHLRHDAYALAARHYREAARLFARVQDHAHSVMADIGLADALTALGELDEAERIYTRAGVRAEAHQLPVLQALVDESVALLDLSRGHYGPALAGFERARAAYERMAMPQHLAIAEKQLADAYLELRLLPEAEALFARAVPQFDALAMPDDKAWTLAQWGRTLALRGEADAAAGHFAAALAVFEAQGNTAGQAAVALARAELALHQRDAASALQWAEAAASACASAEADDGAMRASLARAQALAQAGRHTPARDAFVQTLAQARHRRRLAAEVRCLAGIAAADHALGDSAAARASFEAAVSLAEELRQALPGDEVRSAFLADHLQPYRALLVLALQDHEEEPGPARAAAVLQALDRVRARSLVERLAGGAPVPSMVDEATRALRARVSWLARRLQGLEEDDDTPSATLIDELHQSEQLLLERVRRQRLVAGAAGLVDDRLDIAALQATLAADEALVAYGEVQHGAGDGELLACVVRHDHIVVRRRLAPWSAAVQAVQAARFQIEALGHGATPLQQHLPVLASRCEARLRQLHGMLWAPLADGLAGVRRVLLVAPSPLGALPFAALSDSTAAPIELAWVPSAAAASAARQAPGAPQQALVLGESSRLPHARDEATQVAGVYRHARLHLDEAATADALRDGAPAADTLHLACHAQFRTDSPRFSALHLRDGALTAEQVETLALPAGPLVVLSACETAGQAAQGHAQGDEWLGLVRAFLVAGASRVVASLWPVDDAVTRRFMAHFHQARAAGATPADALGQAQAAVRATHPHPFHWAAFALYGGW
ncbi:MAG: CHAT domain-containing protein [Pseudomonadota bacterium]